MENISFLVCFNLSCTLCCGTASKVTTNILCYGIMKPGNWLEHLFDSSVLLLLNQLSQLINMPILISIILIFLRHFLMPWFMFIDIKPFKQNQYQKREYCNIFRN
jgi:hypothetical protein